MLRFSYFIVALAMLAYGSVVYADESDQFLLPERERFTDIGPYIDLLHYRVLERVVEETNERVERAQRIEHDGRRKAAIDKLHSPDRLAGRARHFFGQGWVVARALESALNSNIAQQVYPDQLVIYFDPDWVYKDSHFVLDPRRIMYNFHGSTVKIHGVYLGVDKIGHGFDLGHLYFRSYRKGLASGLNEQEAMARTLRNFTTGPISEAGIIGAIGTGVQSNADSASNYLGMKFYLNMTEPVMLKGEIHPPLLVRIGDYLALNQHVRPDSSFMAPFYSDHLNEALNPNKYEWGMRKPISRRLGENRDRILAFYADEDGQPRTREYFENLYEELATYYGEDYGHAGVDPVVTIANLLFDDEGNDNDLDPTAEARGESIGLDPAATR